MKKKPTENSGKKSSPPKASPVSPRAKVQAGDSYQAGGDIIIQKPTDPPPPPPKKWWEKWQTILGFIIVCLTVLSMLLDLPKKIKESVQEVWGKPAVTTPLKGIVTGPLNMPVGGAVVKLDKLPGDSVFTTSDGAFKFSKVPGKAGDDVRIYVYAPGYKPRNEYQTLPGPADIQLEKQ